MKRKTINAIITKKMEQWWDTLPDHMRDIVANDTIVTGGCIVSMLLGEKVTDFDVYLKRKHTAKLLADHYVNQFIEKRNQAGGIDIKIWVEEKDDRIRIICKSAGIAGENDPEYDYFEGREPEAAQGYVSEVMDNPGDIEDTYQDTEEKSLENDEPDYRPVFLSTNAITLSKKIQIIIRFYGNPDEIHKNYDFVHCTNYWTKSEGVVLKPDALESIITKELRYVGSRYPVCSLIRTRKFIKRGWTINAGQFVKMAFQISHLDLNDLAVLEDQLTGVDVAYFIQVVELLKDKNTERVESAYLIEILDRMF